MQQITLAPHFRLASLQRYVTVLASAALLVVAAPVFANGTEQLKTFVTRVRAAQGEFTQQVVRSQSSHSSAAPAVSKPTDSSSGTFLFARPGKFIWSYQQPYEQVLQSDGDMLYVYDKDLNQVTQRKLAGALGASPAAILFGSNDLEKNYALRNVGEKDGVDWLEMTPKARDTQFQRISIGFKDGALAEMELQDAFGNTTLLTFTNIHTNLEFKASRFRFTVPKGADVISG